MTATRRIVITVLMAGGLVFLLSGTAQADTCKLGEPDHCKNTAWVPGVTSIVAGTAAAATAAKGVKNAGKKGGGGTAPGPAAGAPAPPGLPATEETVWSGQQAI